MYLISLTPGQKRRIMVVLSFMAILLVARAGLWLTDRGMPAAAGIQPIKSLPGEEKQVALTFNVTWGEQVVRSVLDALKRYEVPATFFVSGPWAAAHPDLIKEMEAAGHTIGSLGYRQVDWPDYPAATIREEILKGRQALNRVAPDASTFLRAPNGDVDEKVLDVATRLGYTLVLWQLDSQDWTSPGTDYIVRQVVEKVQPGDIVLLHASDTATQTPQALPAILEGLQDDGYQLVSLGQALGSDASEEEGEEQEEQQEKRQEEAPAEEETVG